MANPGPQRALANRSGCHASVSRRRLGDVSEGHTGRVQNRKDNDTRHENVPYLKLGKNAAHHGAEAVDRLTRLKRDDAVRKSQTAERL